MKKNNNCLDRSDYFSCGTQIKFYK